MLGREPMPAGASTDEWLKRWKEERRLVWDASKDPSDWDRLAEEQGWHISCWYIFANTGGLLSVWTHNDVNDYEFETVRDWLDEDDFSALAGYDKCADERCRSALKSALRLAVDDAMEDAGLVEVS